MEVDSEHMRMRLMPSPVQCLNAIKVGRSLPKNTTLPVSPVESSPCTTKKACPPRRKTWFYFSQELLPELMEAGSGALLDELDAIIPHISGGSASVEDFVAKKKAVSAAHQDNPRHVEVSFETSLQRLMSRFFGVRPEDGCREGTLTTLASAKLQQRLRSFFSTRACFRSLFEHSRNASDHQQHGLPTPASVTETERDV